MKICGLMKTTLLDYPGKVAATIFVGGCNFRCPFCHNGDLVLHSKELETYSQEEILAFLAKRKNVLEGVCITGGEPTLYPELVAFVEKIKAMGYFVKLDTNGSNPDMVGELLDKKLLDYVAMDIKASRSFYEKVCGVPVDMEKIDRSVRMIMESGVDYEFRTTVVKELHTGEDILEIGRWILGAKAYYLQSYRDSDKNICRNFSAMDIDELNALQKELQKKISLVKVRGVE